jgi:hypothetical protein
VSERVSERGVREIGERARERDRRESERDLRG